jgi:cytidylate kinase
MRPVDFSVAPVHGYRGEEPTPPPLTRPRGLCVAISREAGARGGTIARKVGELLGWQVFDHDTLDYLTQDDTARSQLLRDIPETALAWAEAHLTRLRRDQKLQLDPDTAAMTKLLLTVAARGDVIIVGRGAGFLLPAATTLHVRVVAPLESRITYLAQWLRLTRAEAAAEVEARDQRRARFLARTLGRDANDPTGYDVIVNSDRLGVETAAQFIGWAVRTKQQFAELREDDRTLEPRVG